MADTIDTTGAVDTTAAGQDTPAEKTFTQTELDAIVARRVARLTKGMPDETELTEFRTWKDSRQTEAQRYATAIQERDAARTELAKIQAEMEQMKQFSYVLGKGVSGDEAEFIAFKAAKMVDDKTTFEKAVDELTAPREKKPSFDWTAPLENKPANINQSMNALIRQARR